MPAFTTRVELHDADPDDYEALGREMEKEGFKQTITTDDDMTFRLPPAEFDLSGKYTRVQVLQKAKNAASRTRRVYEVLVTQSKGRSWFGLQKA